MACQWRQVATGRNRLAARGQKQSMIWQKRATAEAEIEPVELQLRLMASAGNQKHRTGDGYRRKKRLRMVSGYVRRASMRGRFPSQFLNLVLECQLASLEIHDFEVVDRWMVHRVIDFTFDVAVFPLQLIKMGCKRHDWFSLSWFPRLQPSRRVHRRFAFCDGTVTVCHLPATMSNDPW